MDELDFYFYHFPSLINFKENDSTIFFIYISFLNSKITSSLLNQLLTVFNHCKIFAPVHVPTCSENLYRLFNVLKLNFN